MVFTLLSLPQEILDNIYKHLAQRKRIRYTPPVSECGVIKLPSKVHPMALVTKQQSTKFTESMIKHSTAVFKSLYDLLHFIRSCRTKAFVKYITLSPTNEFGPWLEDLSALVLQELIPSVPHLRRLRFTMDAEIIITLPPDALIPTVDYSAPKTIFSKVKEGELDMRDISTDMLAMGQPTIEMHPESGTFFWAVVNKLDLFNPNRPHNFAVELRSRVRFEYGALMWTGTMSHVMATARFDFQHGDLVLSIDGCEAIIIPQRPWICPAPADQLQAVLLRTATLDNQVSTLVNQMTGEKITIGNRLAMMDYLTRAKNEPVQLVLLYAFLRITKPDIIFDQVKDFESQTDLWRHGPYVVPLRSKSPGNKPLVVSGRKKLFRLAQASLAPKAPLQSEEEAEALIKKVLGKGGFEVTYRTRSVRRTEKHRAGMDEALVEAFVAANGLDWGQDPMLWVREAVHFVRGRNWSFEQECTAFVECYQ